MCSSRLDIYNKLYNNYKSCLPNKYGEDKSSRIANKFAIKHTWIAYNNMLKAKVKKDV